MNGPNSSCQQQLFNLECHQRLPIKTAEFRLIKKVLNLDYHQSCLLKVRGFTRAHTLESQVHTGTILHHFFHPESPAHTDWSHVRTQPFSRVTRAHRLESQVHTGTILHHFFHPESPAHTSHGIGWGGDDDILLHLHTCSKRCAMDCFGTYFTHVQTCNVTRVQSATEWTASVHTLHMSKPVM